MHAVPRRFALDEKNYRPDAARWRRYARFRNPQNRGRQYRWTNDLRIRRSLRMANAKFRRKIQRRIRRTRSETGSAADAARVHTRRINHS